MLRRVRSRGMNSALHIRDRHIFPHHLSTMLQQRALRPTAMSTGKGTWRSRIYKIMCLYPARLTVTVYSRARKAVNTKIPQMSLHIPPDWFFAQNFWLTSCLPAGFQLHQSKKQQKVVITASKKDKTGRGMWLSRYSAYLVNTKFWVLSSRLHYVGFGGTYM